MTASLLRDMQLCPSRVAAGMRLPSTEPARPGLGPPRDRSPCPSRPSDPQQDSMGSHALVQLMPKQPQPGTLEQSRSSIQQGEKPMVNLEPTPKQTRAEWNSTPKSGSAGRLTKRAAERHWGLNPGPCARQACMLPLSHTSPNSCMCFLVGLLSHNFT
nr:phospholipase A and acyltransferase 5-like isoform X3 [Vicugna pacos]